MGYPVQPTAPKVTYGGTTYAVGMFSSENPVGVFIHVGVFEQVNGGWNAIMSVNGNIATYANAGDFMLDITKMGGAAKYLAYIIAQVNRIFAQMAGTVPPAGEPITDAEAIAYMQTHLAGLKFTLVNGVPVLG
jgi:hypothetical protein